MALANLGESHVALHAKTSQLQSSSGIDNPWTARHRSKEAYMPLTDQRMTIRAIPTPLPKILAVSQQTRDYCYVLPVFLLHVGLVMLSTTSGLVEKFKCHYLELPSMVHLNMLVGVPESGLNGSDSGATAWETSIRLPSSELVIILTNEEPSFLWY